MDVLDTKAVAALLGVANATVRYWRQVGEGPAWFRLGPKIVRYRRSAVEGWLVEREQASRSGLPHPPAA